MNTEIQQEELAYGLIVVGSSAGGVEALSILVSTLPANFPTPIVLAQHLDPTRPSNLDEILRRRTPLPVEVVANHTELKPGTIYVVPSNRHVSIQDHQIELITDHSKRPRPSVDTLLSTAAQAYGDRLIAAILTGSGSDGAIGAIDVKNVGGTVIVQDPQTARYPSMPLALPPTVVDFEVNIEQIGPLLYDLVVGIKVSQTEERTEDVLQDILKHVSRSTHVNFQPYKASTLLRRIGRRMAVTHQLSMREYADYLNTHPKEVGELVQAFLINVTQFFRDPEAFAYLRSDILPQLIARARQKNQSIRIWTAGCATGEEAYSLAMLLTDMLDAELPEWDIKIFATDLDDAAVNFARRGLYSANLLKGLPQGYKRFFERADHGYRIAKMLRQMVIFGQHDLSRSAPFPHIDLILCRNVLIYFTPELQEYVLHQFTFSLYPDGFLFLGKAETVHPMQSFYEQVSKHWKVYRCVNSALPAMRRLALLNTGDAGDAGDTGDTGDAGDAAASGRRVNPKRLPSQAQSMIGKSRLNVEATAPPFEIGQLRRMNELLLRFMPVGVVIINRSYHMISVNGTARRLLELRDSGGDQDFLHAMRGIPYHELRMAIDKVFNEHNPVNLPEVELDIATGGSGRFLGFSIVSMLSEAGTPDLVIISITDVTPQVQLKQQLETVRTEQAQMMDELKLTNKRLSEVNKELIDSNEELQVANEELVLTHEELQASLEEFETTNEELQATNEELETNNEELQATNEELETTNDELRSRTTELQELTATLEVERARLAEMVTLAPYYILVLRGPQLLVEAYNPRYARFLESKDAQGRSIDEVGELFWKGNEIVQLAREAYHRDLVQATPPTLTYLPSLEEEPGQRQELSFTYTIVPTHNAAGKVDGLILYAVDETEQRLQDAVEERERLRLIFENFSMAAVALFDAKTTELMMGNSRYFDLVTLSQQLPPEQLIGLKWSELTFMTPPEQAQQIWQHVQETRTTHHIPEFSAPLVAGNPENLWDYRMIPLMHTKGKQTVRFMLMLAIDITEQVRARQELEQVDSLKDEFLSLTTHELRSPLTGILGNTQMVQRLLKRHETFSLDDIQRELALLDQVIHQTHRINKLIAELVDMTRIRGHVFEMHTQDKVDITELVQRVAEQYASTQREIIVKTPKKIIQCACDTDRIEQVLHNLISNALKYSPSEKPVLITLEQKSSSPKEAIISIKDYGSGLSEQEQAQIFERFYRSSGAKKGKAEGLGLGLYIAHEIIAQQGGKLWVESKPGQGSTFRFSLPMEN